ncbi:MAG: TonB family protein [Pyrinomonadaceae bacterium]
MLENLVESKNNSRAARKLYGLLFSTFLVVATMLVTATVWSLFAKDFVMGNDGMELSALMTPIPVETEEPKPEPEKPKQQNQPQNARPQPAIRRTNMASVEEIQRVPEKVSVAPNTNKARPTGAFIVDPNAVERNASVPTGIGREIKVNTGPGFIKSDDKSTAVEITKPKNLVPPPALKKTEDVKKISGSISLGVINGKASSLPVPPYPAAAKAVGASGAVNVQVMIDEQGNVVSAKAVSGHPLLRDAAERAARSARFSPTLLSKVPVKVNGLIIYNFTK